MTASSQLHAPAALLPEVRRLGGQRSRSERFGEDKNLLSTANRIPDPPARSLVTMPTELLLQLSTMPRTVLWPHIAD